MTTNASLRGLPSVDRVLADPALAPLLAGYAREVVVEAVRRHLASARDAARAGAAAPSAADLAREVVAERTAAWQPWPTAVINATGVILHTNLGRAPLSAASLRAAADAGANYTDLELDLRTGKRGTRHHAVAALLRELTGAQDAIAVNNNAGAMLLGLAAIAARKQVIVSRGESAEIGGGFRIPDVLRQSGAKLVEVGTVNRTYARDYEDAITPRTAALLVVHRSNFRVVGFTEETALADVLAVGRRAGVPVLHDLGSGALLDTATYGLGHEPMPQESIAAGADLVFFSGDKLLGGPQAGIVVGAEDRIAALVRHPLARALRADKLTLAALHATLLHYVRGEVPSTVPIWRMVAADIASLRRRAGSIARAIGPAARTVDGTSTLGGGSLPGDILPTRLVSLSPAGVLGGADGLSARLRTGTPAVMARIESGAVLLDPRTVPPERDAALIGAVRAGLSAARAEAAPSATRRVLRRTLSFKGEGEG